MDELESRLLRDVNFFMRDTVGVARLRDELTDLDDFEGRCGSFEGYSAVELCVLMSSLTLYESTLRLPSNATRSSSGAEEGETKEIDLERGATRDIASLPYVGDKLGLKLNIAPKLLESIRDSGNVQIARKSLAYEVSQIRSSHPLFTSSLITESMWQALCRVFLWQHQSI